MLTGGKNALTLVSCPTHPQWISHHTALGGGLNLPSSNWFGPCSLSVSTHLDWTIYRMFCEDMSLKKEINQQTGKKGTDFPKCETENGSFLGRQFPVGLTLATVACIEPWAIPGAHGRVYTGNSGRIDLWVFAGLLGACQFIFCIT